MPGAVLWLPYEVHVHMHTHTCTQIHTYTYMDTHTNKKKKRKKGNIFTMVTKKTFLLSSFPFQALLCKNDI